MTDKRAGHAVGKLVSASFIFPGPDLLPWDHEASQETRFYRKYDAQPLYGAIILAQLFKVGIAQHDRKNGKLSLKFGTDPVWDNRLGFRKKAEGRRPIRKAARWIDQAKSRQELIGPRVPNLQSLHEAASPTTITTRIQD